MEAAGVDTDPFVRAIGNEQVGWKVAFCERDVAIYGSIFITGIAYALLRKHLSAKRMSLRIFALFLVPMAIDGILQLFGFYESTWEMRSLTGAIFGIGAALFAYPYVEEGFADVRKTINRKLHLE